MIRLPKRPVLTWRQIAATAKEFAEQYGLAEREFPLDIEQIVEFDLGIEIRLAEGILEEFDSPAQIAPGDDQPIITVDADQYKLQTSFYRFSLAHEIGHFVLHRDWLNQVWSLIQSVDTWKQVILARSDEDYGWIESQANQFASFLLAPEVVFEPFLKEQLKPLWDVATKLDPDDILPYLANPVEQQFGMSNSAAQARIRKSEQWKQFIAL